MAEFHIHVELWASLNDTPADRAMLEKNLSRMLLQSPFVMSVLHMQTTAATQEEVANEQTG